MGSKGVRTSRELPEQLIRVGPHQIALPSGVTVTDWALERVQVQNPRIRALLGCIQLLDGVLESNYAILHCSPERLLDIWQRVRKVSHLIRADIGPLLAHPSRIPVLERARQSALSSFDLLEETLLDELDRFPEDVPQHELLELRKLLCVSIGQLHAFLQDTFGELMASDPRSIHDADYFLSRRFPRDIEEAEWLHATVERLATFLEQLLRERPRHVTTFSQAIRRHPRVPEGRSWEEATRFLRSLVKELIPKLKEILALRGIRFDEMEVLDRYTLEIPANCQLILEGHATALKLIAEVEKATGDSLAEHNQCARDLDVCHRVLSLRLARLMEDIEAALSDLAAFIPLWLTSIERRRALLLRRNLEETA